MKQSWVKTSDGVDLAVYETGNPDGPELLMIHGVAQSHLCFAGQFASELGRTCRIVTFDLRGHGASAKPLDPAPYRNGRRWAEDVETVIDAAGLRRPILVGWSLGGRITRQYLITYGDRRLSGVNFVGSRVIEHPDAMSNWNPNYRFPSDLAGHIETAISFLEACFHRQPSEAEFRTALAYNMLVPLPVRSAITGWSTGIDETVATLNRVTVPVLVSQGRQDRVVRPVAAEMLAAAVSTARLSWYDECGHSPFVEARERFNRELAAFVRECWNA